VPAPPETTVDRERLVLIADPSIDEGKLTTSSLASWGLQTLLVHDGVEAILTIQRALPRVVIIDAALPKMYGFQICELLKRNESLRHIPVVLIGAIHDHARYRRPPAELYGADVYLERQQLPDALRPILQQLGVPMSGAPAAPTDHAPPPPIPKPDPVTAPPPPPPRAVPTREPAAFAPPEPVAAPPEPVAAPPEPVAAPPPPMVSAPQAMLTPPEDPALDPEVAKAERLARIVVSDIILYNQEKFDAAVQSGEVEAGMDSELAEGRALFARRIDASIRETRDFLADELRRMARMRRSQ
jgi:CheY-like chemotaxis protein